MRAVIIITALVLGSLTAGVGLVHGTRSEPFVLMVAASTLVLGWLLIRFAVERYGGK